MCGENNVLASHQGDPGSISSRVTPDFRMWESCRTMPLVGGFSRRSPVSPTLSFRRCSILTSITIIGFQDLAVKRRPNLFTHFTHPYKWDICLHLNCGNRFESKPRCRRRGQDEETVKTMRHDGRRFETRWRTDSLWKLSLPSDLMPPPAKGLPPDEGIEGFFGFRFRVWMPSFFMLSGLFTCGPASNSAHWKGLIDFPLVLCQKDYQGTAYKLTYDITSSPMPYLGFEHRTSRTPNRRRTNRLRHGDRRELVAYRKTDLTLQSVGRGIVHDDNVSGFRRDFMAIALCCHNVSRIPRLLSTFETRSAPSRWFGKNSTLCVASVNCRAVNSGSHIENINVVSWLRVFVV
ncbi:hypothetical protein PR048_028076 [Dryococelus australis]|uniref:Uncharacterized protein n=1 Tax=Dryococelus australis TaxID=614101 RepID=A0ABQ9GI76_9NEOP|nr:hypothetical protein PR048_028076 [Dryococelus australis]